ncbi:purine-cytosine permease family protein, partial [Alcaligenes sp.]|uniref:purine-cytosine permease family protein n=1 Tax=Alcaligenes sp. TaxID=512 RepID=UPI003D057C78
RLPCAKGERFLPADRVTTGWSKLGRFGYALACFIFRFLRRPLFASNIVLAGQSFNGIVPSVSVPVGIIFGAVGSGVIVMIGYRFIHYLNRIATWVMGLSILAGFMYIVTHVTSTDFLSRGEFTVSGWLSMVSIAALWQIAFAPYVSDYSRYLPENTTMKSTFWATYLGSVLGSSLSFIFGAVAVLAVAPGPDAMDAVRIASGPFGLLMLVLFLLSVITHNALNLYGAVLSIITSVQTFVSQWMPAARARVTLCVVIIIFCSYAAIGVSSDFITHFVDLVLTLLVVLVPWASINLVDFYVVQKSKYHIESIFRDDGGIYGRFNLNAMMAYAVGIVIQVPFMNTPMYTGPLPAHLNGVDLSWLIGIAVTVPVYWWLALRDTSYRRKQIEVMSSLQG